MSMSLVLYRQRLDHILPYNFAQVVELLGHVPAFSNSKAFESYF